MVMSMMIALHQWEEFKLHVRAALTHGFSKDDIKEIILQATVYCGAPGGQPRNAGSGGGFHGSWRLNPTALHNSCNARIFN